MEELTAALTQARRALAPLASSGVAAPSCGDDELLAAIGLAAAVLRDAELVQSRLAAEVAHRSRTELGHQGLAALRGAASAVSLVATMTRSSHSESSRQIRVGRMLAEAELTSGMAAERASDVPFAPLARAVATGVMGIDAADRIARTLQPVIDHVDGDLLADAMTTLAIEAAHSTADELSTLARGVRDTLDRIGVADRERFLRSQRGLRRGRVVDGLRRVTLTLDPESDVVVIGAIDHALSPRFGGPRFTDPAGIDRARRLADDDRSNEQLALDTLVQLVRAGVDHDDGTILGGIKPGVRVTIPLADLRAGVEKLAVGSTPEDATRERGLTKGAPSTDGGIAWLEGHPEPVSAATARRLLCESGALPVVLGGGGPPLDVGRTRRLFTASQRVALAIRDGGCMFTGCDRPPSWCEAHHLDPWTPRRPRDRGGASDLENGILLCRRHHLILHDQGWIVRRGRDPGQFELVPPSSVDLARTARTLRSKAPPWLSTG